MPKVFDKSHKITYPKGCKELSESLSNDELVKRLKAVARCFQDIGQEDNSDLKELALYLSSEFFLDHQSRDVKCLVACCIADIFRIFAPDAPYTDGEHLKEIFMFLTRQLKGLEDPEGSTFRRYFYLLENLAWVRSFNICLELDDNQQIFCELFRMFFNIVNEKHSNKVLNFMLDMLCPLISDSDNVSQDLLDIILTNIIEPTKSANKVAHTLAKDLIRRTANALEPYVQNFFNNLLMLGKTSESELSGRLFDLIYELNMIAPSVLLAVLPQLEFKLKSSDKRERKAVTKLLAKMFSDPESELATQNRPLWVCFLGRFKDIELEIRKACVQSCQDFILNHAELVPDIAEALRDRCHDTDESVRMDVIQAVVGAGKRDYTRITDPLLDCVKDRILDKKYNIRKEALTGLGAIYKKCSMSEEVEKEHLERFGWVKNKVLHAYYQNSVEDRVLVERILNMSLVPYSLETMPRMKRLLALYCSVDEHALKAMNELFKTQMNVRAVLRGLLELHERKVTAEGTEHKNQLLHRIMALSRNLPDSNKAQAPIREFSELMGKDARVRASVGRLLAPDCPCVKAGDYVKDILQKCGKCVSGNLLYSNVKMLLERVAPVMIDRDAVDALVVYMNDAVNGLGEICDVIPDVQEKGMRLLLLFSYVYPGAFHTEDIYVKLISFVKNEDDTVADTTVQIFTNVGQTFEKDFPNIYSSLVPVLQKLVKIGTPKQAKHAIRCISVICKEKERMLAQIFEHIKKNMELDSPNFLTSIVAMGHMAHLWPGEFAPQVKNIVSKFIVKELLMKDQGQSRMSNESWYADHLVSEETHAKVAALKMMVRWLLGLKSDTNHSASSTIRLYYTVIVHEGDLMEKGKINKAEMARLRLQAGCCLLKLAQESVFQDLITLEYFQALAFLINDACYQVRLRFAQKLHKGLLPLRLPLQYMSIFSLGANDPLKERRTQIKNYLVTNITKRREYLRTSTAANAKMFSVLPDYVLPYAIHLLSHDPDLQSHQDVESLKNIKNCLWFVMEPLISKNENYSYSFYKNLIENIKQTKDAQSPEDNCQNEKLYAVCDLALSLVMTKSTTFILKDFPADPVLPAKLFTSPDQNYSNTTVYLPMELRVPQNKKKFPTSYMPGPPPTTVKSAEDKPPPHQEAAAVSPTSSSPERPVSSASPVTSPSEASPPPTNTGAQHGRGRKARKQQAVVPTATEEMEEEEVSRVGKRGRRVKNTGATKKTSDRESSTESSISEQRSASKLGSKAANQGKITDYITRGSLSPINKENKPSTANSTSKRLNTRSNSIEKTVASPKRGNTKARDQQQQASQVISSTITGTRKRGSTATSRSSSVESSPMKRQKVTAKAAQPKSPVRRNTRQISSDRESDTGSVRSSPRKPSATPTKSNRGQSSVPSSPSVGLSPVKKVPGRTAKTKANVRHATRKLLNGTSAGDSTPDSKQSTPSPVKRKAAALTRAIHQQGTQGKRKTRKNSR